MGLLAKNLLAHDQHKEFVMSAIFLESLVIIGNVDVDWSELVLLVVESVPTEAQDLGHLFLHGLVGAAAALEPLVKICRPG